MLLGTFRDVIEDKRRSRNRITDFHFQGPSFDVAERPTRCSMFNIPTVVSAPSRRIETRSYLSSACFLSHRAQRQIRMSVTYSVQALQDAYTARSSECPLTFNATRTPMRTIFKPPRGFSITAANQSLLSQDRSMVVLQLEVTSSKCDWHNAT